MTVTEQPHIGQRLKQEPVPFHLSSRRLAPEVANHPENIQISRLERERFMKILDLLGHPEMNNAIAAGEFTLGIIKPNAYEGIGMPSDDELAAEMLLDEVKSRGIDVVFSASIQLSRKEAERFYAEHAGKPFFDRLVEFTSSAPMTYLLIHDKSGNAIKSWRDEIGSTKVKIGEAVPGHPERQTLRSRFRNPTLETNNVFHGSDRVEAALLEITNLRYDIEALVEQLASDKPGFPTEKDLVQKGLLNPDTDQLISIEKTIFDPAGGEEKFVVRYANQEGTHVATL